MIKKKLLRPNLVLSSSKITTEIDKKTFKAKPRPQLRVSYGANQGNYSANEPNHQRKSDGICFFQNSLRRDENSGSNRCANQKTN